jgi:predicted HTH domain antitoxin
LELLQTGAISFDKAAAFLKISPEQLSARLAQLALRG